MSAGFIGEVRLFPYSFTPAGWLPCDGSLLGIEEYPALYGLIGTTFGGDGTTTFAVPDLRGRTALGAGAATGLTARTVGETGGSEAVTLTEAQLPAHSHPAVGSAAQATTTSPAGATWAVDPDGAPYAPGTGTSAMAPSAVAATGGGQAHPNRSPVVGIGHAIRFDGVHPAGGDDGDTTLGEIRLMAGATPQGWFPCDGRTLPISANQALFSILGTTYGGNGIQAFAVPDLRGRVPVHTGPQHPIGAAGGAEAVTLTRGQMPAHTHPAQGTSAAASASSPAGATWAVTDGPRYAAGPQVVATDLGSAGGSQPHPNMPPFAVLTYVIATTGVYPSPA